MTTASATISTRRPDLQQRGHEFKLMNYIITYLAVLSVMSRLFSAYPTDSICVFIKHALAVTFVIAHMWWTFPESYSFILERRPYGIGDVIEIDPSDLSRVSPDFRNVWRVEAFTLSHTDLVPLFGGAWTSWPNGMLAKSQITNWTDRKAKYHIILRVYADAPDGLFVLGELYEMIKQFAKDNSCDWHAVAEPTSDAVMVEDEYKDYCIEIKHRSLWSEYELVMRSYFELNTYCGEQEWKLNDPKFKERSAVGDGNNGGGGFIDHKDGSDDSSDRKIHYIQEEKKETEGVGEEAAHQLSNLYSIGMEW